MSDPTALLHRAEPPSFPTWPDTGIARALFHGDAA